MHISKLYTLAVSQCWAQYGDRGLIAKRYPASDPLVQRVDRGGWGVGVFYRRPRAAYRGGREYRIFYYLCDMDESKIIVRRAEVGDAPLIAEVVCMAVGYDISHPIYSIVLSLAQRIDTQYSYRNTLVAEVGGVAAGAVVGYDGARLVELRKHIYPLLREHLGTTPHIEDETEAGEYYLDSLAVLSAYRRRGVGEALVNELCNRVFDEGYGRVGLIVEQHNHRAEHLYKTLGFERVGERKFLGDDMWHMQRSTPYNVAERIERSTIITPFQRRVYRELLNVPAGETITYGELARRIGCRSAQAVGQALRRNPFAPDVPCHRVVAADGTLGGYNGARGGKELERKRRLLQDEKRG